MAKQSSITASDREWQARSDASTLSEAKVIMSDTKRLGAAAKAADKMAKDKAEEAKAMKAVANKAPKSAQKTSKRKNR